MRIANLLAILLVIMISSCLKDRSQSNLPGTKEMGNNMSQIIVPDRALNNKERFKTEFKQFQELIRKQQAQGRSLIMFTSSNTQWLADRAHENEDFLKAQLASNPYVFWILDRSTILVKKYGMKPRKGNAMEDRQQEWLNALNGNRVPER